MAHFDQLRAAAAGECFDLLGGAGGFDLLGQLSPARIWCLGVCRVVFLEPDLRKCTESVFDDNYLFSGTMYCGHSGPNSALTVRSC